MSEPEPMSNSPRGSTPVPDPTQLTDQAIEKAVHALTQYIDGKVEVLAQRMDGIDTATDRRYEVLESMHKESRDWVSNLRELHQEKFDSVQTQFRERDTRSEREARDNKVAVDAAFAAQKEAATKQDESNQKAIDKSEAATAEQIRKLAELFTTTINGMGDKIDDVKERVSRIEATKLGAGEAKQEHVADRTGLYATIGIVISVILVSLTVLAFIAAQVARA